MHKIEPRRLGVAPRTASLLIDRSPRLLFFFQGQSQGRSIMSDDDSQARASAVASFAEHFRLYMKIAGDCSNSDWLDLTRPMIRRIVAYSSALQPAAEPGFSSAITKEACGVLLDGIETHLLDAWVRTVDSGVIAGDEYCRQEREYYALVRDYVELRRIADAKTDAAEAAVAEKNAKCRRKDPETTQTQQEQQIQKAFTQGATVAQIKSRFSIGDKVVNRIRLQLTMKLLLKFRAERVKEKMRGVRPSSVDNVDKNFRELSLDELMVKYRENRSVSATSINRLFAKYNRTLL